MSTPKKSIEDHIAELKAKPWYGDFQARRLARKARTGKLTQSDLEFAAKDPNIVKAIKKMGSM